MNVALVDHLVCPRCGPPNGLLLLAHDVRDRRVHEGEFGCPNCRDRFPVVDGFGDLRPPPRGAVVGVGGSAAAQDAVSAGRAGGGKGRSTGGFGEGREATETGGGGAAPDRALALAAALGVARGPGLIVVPGSHREEAAHIARLVRGIEVLVVGWGGRGVVAEGTDAGGVSAFVTGPRLPLRDGAVRGVVADGDGGEEWWDEGRRVLVPGGRIAISGGTDEARDWVRGAGLGVVLDERGMVVGAVPVPGGGLKLTGLGP